MPVRPSAASVFHAACVRAASRRREGVAGQGGGRLCAVALDDIKEGERALGVDPSGFIDGQQPRILRGIRPAVSQLLSELVAERVHGRESVLRGGAGWHLGPHRLAAVRPGDRASEPAATDLGLTGYRLDLRGEGRRTNEQRRRGEWTIHGTSRTWTLPLQEARRCRFAHPSISPRPRVRAGQAHLVGRLEISEATAGTLTRSPVSSKPDLSLPVSEGLPDEASLDRSPRFEWLVRGFGRLVAHAVRRVAGAAAPNDLADIEQDVMLALWKRVGAEQDIEHPASYVYRAAVREAVRAVARIRHRAEEPLPDAEAPELKVVPATGDQVLADRERRDMLREALAALPPDRARAVRAHLRGMSVQELMQLTGWDYQRARNLIARGMADLRRELRTRGMA